MLSRSLGLCLAVQTMTRPAVSPFGHVLGMATWVAVLADGGRCPFTQSPLRREQVTLSLLCCCHGGFINGPNALLTMDWSL